MARYTKTLERVLRGDADANVDFSDLRALLVRLGFTERIRGSHHIFSHARIAEILNIQSKGHRAKPYQVKQVRAVITAHRLASAGETDDSSGFQDSDKSGAPAEEDNDE